jgi:membrane protease YdiL (CAAX protease family)
MRPKHARLFRFNRVTPFLFLVLHYLVLNVAARLRLLWFLNTADPESAVYDRFNPSSMREAMLNADVQNYASFFMALIMIPLYVFYLWRRKKTDKEMIRLRQLPASDVFASLSVMIGSLGLVTLWMTFLLLLGEKSSWLSGLLDDYAKLAGTFSPKSSSIFFMTLTIVILVPRAEELLFRGIIQGELSFVMPRKWAVVLTVVLFSFFHLNPIQISYVALPAFILSYVYVLTENFLVPVLMHMLFNFLGSGLFSAVTGIGAEVQIVAQWFFIGVGFVALLYLRKKDAVRRASESVSEEERHENPDYQ